jgi:putative endonuclease
MFYIYILQSELDWSFYIGFTENIESRVYEHNFGRTGYSKSKRPWKLIYSEEFGTRTEAIKRERYLKKLKSRRYIEKLVAKGP